MTTEKQYNNIILYTYRIAFILNQARTPNSFNSLVNNNTKTYFNSSEDGVYILRSRCNQCAITYKIYNQNTEAFAENVFPEISITQYSIKENNGTAASRIVYPPVVVH